MSGFIKKLFARKLDQHEQRCVDNIREHGCQVQWVFDPDGNDPDFSYSIGFPTSVGKPEVIIFGLNRELLHRMVNDVRAQCADGLILSDGLRVGGLLEGFDCVARRVTDLEAFRRYMGWAIWYHRSQLKRPLIEAYQLVWPSAATGLFPWDEGCHEDVITLQPALYQTRPVA